MNLVLERKTVIFEDDHIKVISHAGASDYVLITFGNLAQQAKSEKFPMQNLCEKLDLNCIAILPTAANWFPEQSMLLAIREIAQFIVKFDHKILYASSMGAYAAIKYSKLLNASIVYAFAPQYSIDPKVIDDKRYNMYFNESLNTNMHLRNDDIVDNIYVFYDDFCKLDQDHINLMVKNNIKIQTILCRNGGHSVQNFLKGTDFYLSLIDFYFKKKDKNFLIKQTKIAKNKYLLDYDSSAMKIAFSRHPGMFFNIYKKLDLKDKKVKYLRLNKTLPYVMNYARNNLSDEHYNEFFNKILSTNPFKNRASIFNFNKKLLTNYKDQVLTFNRISRKIECISPDLLKGNIFSVPLSVNDDVGLIFLKIDNKDYFLVYDDENYSLKRTSENYSGTGYIVYSRYKNQFTIKCKDEYLSSDHRNDLVFKACELTKKELFSEIEILK
ncbi:hypothetical protein SAMN05421749_103322 [Acinetobacter marinus]|uniref:Alpha/beta hydrolase n=1 Tax=Acinetobacter marinus TaxID=281375 RepID=A0A1G6JDE3_9GAMM|nr:hypothetical protein [Acinetobacter marinus]SDC16824.1 hypothetical protein SAMN05421749_103322 [Acinetobacter marinus]